ncbi:MAG: GAF domain-containing protein, partial [Anaerolineales bacterium]
MHYYFTAVSLMAGICLGFGILYLFIGLRRKDNKPLNLTFALFALCYAATLFNGIRWYSTTIVTEYITITRFDSIFVTGAFIGLIWYISYYTGFRPRIFLWVLSAAFLVPSLVFIISPATFTGEVSGLINIILPWGESLSDLDSAGSVWLDIVLLARLVTLGYIIVALIRQFRRGERQPAIILGLGMLPFIAGIFYEVLGESGFVPYIPFGEVGFLGVAIAASLQMANSVIKTEGALEQHRHNLEGLVEERTTELERSNLQLTHEISQRKQGETALRQSERQARALLNAPPDTAMLLSPEGIILETNEIGAQRLGVSLAEAIGTNAFELFEPSIAEIRWKKAEEVLASKQAVRWEDERDGKHYANSLYPILDENEDVISLAVFAADITGRKKVEEALHHKIEDLNVLNQVGHVVTSAMDMPVALQRIAEIISGHFQARYSHIILQEEKEEGLMVLMGYDRESGSIKPTNLDISLGSLPLVNDVMTTGESLVISDPQSLSLPPDVCDFLQEHHIQGVILVPLRIIGAVSGIMVVSHDQPGRSFTKDEVLLAETIADDVSRTVEIARLQEQEKKAAAAEERSRLARDLHDSVTQTMYSVSIVAEALPRLLNRD